MNALDLRRDDALPAAPAPISVVVPRDATVAVAASKPFVKVLEARGADATRHRLEALSILLPKYGLSAAALAGDDARIPHCLSLEMMSRSAHWLGTEAIVLRALDAWTLGDQGLGDYLNATCATVGDFLRTCVDHVGLLHDGLRFRLEDDGIVARLSCDLDDGVVPSPWLTEMTLGKVVMELRRAFAGSPAAEPIRVRFTHAAPAYQGQLAELLGARVDFGDDVDALEWRSEALSRSVPTSDPILHAILRKQAGALLRANPSRPNLLDRVRSAIADELARGGGAQEVIAKRVGVSTATLRRRLELEHGVRYSDVVEEMRRERAAQALSDCELTIDEISYRMGFSQTAAFYRAFKRWFGCTPAEYRRAHARVR